MDVRKVEVHPVDVHLGNVHKVEKYEEKKEKQKIPRGLEEEGSNPNEKRIQFSNRTHVLMLSPGRTMKGRARAVLTPG